jgi:hypothetical protein
MTNDIPDAVSPALCLSVQERSGDSWVYVCSAVRLLPAGALLVPPLPEQLSRPGAAPPGFRLVVGAAGDVTSDRVLAAPVSRVHLSEPDPGGQRHVAVEVDLPEAGAARATTAADPRTVPDGGSTQDAHAVLATVLAEAVGPDPVWLARAEEALRNQPPEGPPAQTEPRLPHPRSTADAGSPDWVRVLFPGLVPPLPPKPWPCLPWPCRRWPWLCD